MLTVLALNDEFFVFSSFDMPDSSFAIVSRPFPDIYGRVPWNFLPSRPV
jgi:hypothetical protein